MVIFFKKIDLLKKINYNNKIIKLIKNKLRKNMLIMFKNNKKNNNNKNIVMASYCF